MLAARLHGPRDIRVEELPAPTSPGPGEVLLAVSTVGVCGSDLHTFADGRIGDTKVETPLILGHEFAGTIIACGADALDGAHKPLRVGQRVAVDPTVSCHYCEMCEAGHPNLCPNHYFYGLWPHHGALQEQMICAARNCYPVPSGLTDTAAAMLEPLGVAMHAVDLAKLRVAHSAVILGCGPIGLLTLRMARLAGAAPIYVFDRHRWRADKALAWGADGAWTLDAGDPVQRVNELTGGRGTDVVFEAAWADESIQQAAAMTRMGGRLVLIGIPGEDMLAMRHSTARRKGLTVMLVRRMKHTYPRAIQLATTQAGNLDLDDIVSHRFALQDAAKAFALANDYVSDVHKVMIDVQR